MELPRKINLGSGKDFRADYLNIDVNPMWKPDLLWDLSRTEPFLTRHLERFGMMSIQEGFFEEIQANDVLEHIPDLVRTMTNCLYLLRVGGVMNIVVPYDLSYGAWQDPTHVRAFNERSWLYYTDWFWYLGWRTHRFKMTRLDFAMEPGFEAEANSKKTHPRAIAAMHVTLEKIELTDAEKKMGEGHYARK